MSGIAIAASTMPGRVATFWSCSSERSRRIAARSSSSAKIRAGTRMSARASAGISYRVSSIHLSDIEHHARLPRAVLLPKLELVVGRGLHDRLDLGHAALECGADTAVDELDVRLVGDERVGVREVDELVEEADEKARVVAALHGDPTSCGLALRRQLDEPAECLGSLAEDLLGRRCPHEELDLGRVLAPLMHDGARWRCSLRSDLRTRPRLLSTKDARDPPPPLPTLPAREPAPSSAPKQSSVSVEMTLRR